MRYVVAMTEAVGALLSTVATLSVTTVSIAGSNVVGNLADILVKK